MFGCQDQQVSVIDDEIQDEELTFAKIPLLSDKDAAKQISDNQSDYYCLVSTLHDEGNDNPYRYSSVWLHYPKGIMEKIERENTDEVWMSVVIGDLDASGIKGASTYRGDGIVRMARCLVPDLPEARQMIQDKTLEFSSDSWVGKSKQSAGKSFHQNDSTICAERWVTEVCRSAGGVTYDCVITEDRCVEYDYGDTWPENDRDQDDDYGGPSGGGYPDPDADDGCDEYGDPCITSGSLPVECAEGGDEEDLDPGMNKTIADDMILYSASGNMTLDSTCSDEEEEDELKLPTLNLDDYVQTQDTIPNCNENQIDAWKMDYCASKVPEDIRLNRINEALMSIKIKGGVCSEIASVGKNILEKNGLRIFPRPERDFSVAGGWGIPSIGDGVVLIMDEWVDNWFNRSTTVIDNNGVQINVNLEFVLIHEIEHAMGIAHVSNSKWLTPNALECTGQN